MSRILILSATFLPLVVRVRRPDSRLSSAARPLSYSASNHSLRVPRSAATRSRASSRRESGPRPRDQPRSPASPPALGSHWVVHLPLFRTSSPLVPREATASCSDHCLRSEGCEARRRGGSARGLGRPLAERAHNPEARRPVHGRAAPERRVSHHSLPYSMIWVTTPEPTVRPPSRIANLSSLSIAIGVISSTSICTLSPGITISTPSGRCAAPVTSVVRK